LFYQSGFYEFENTYSLIDSTGVPVSSDGPAPSIGMVYSDTLAVTADCDDSNPSINPQAFDVGGDGIDQDCDGSDASDDADGDGYPADQDCDDGDASLNFLDADGDGYSTCPAPTTCYTLHMEDSYGDGWNGGALGLYVDGVFSTSYAAAGSESTEEFCIATGSQLELYYLSGAWEAENSYTLYDSAGTVLLADGPSPSIGFVYNETAPESPSDCDDSNASAYPGAPETANDLIDQDCDGQDLALMDADGDGSVETEDCNDNDLTLNYSDADGDGFTTCPASTTCYLLEMEDSYGDGWNGAFLTLYVNQTLSNYYWVDESSQSAEFCVTPGDELMLFYSEGSWEMEVTYRLSTSYGVEVFADGPYPQAGISYHDTAPEVADCNDNNPLIAPAFTEQVGDGVDQNCNGLDDE